MGNVRKTSKSGSVEKIFDRLTVLVIGQELLMSGVHGPLNAKQKAVLTDLVHRSREIAVLLREAIDL